MQSSFICENIFDKLKMCNLKTAKNILLHIKNELRKRKEESEVKNRLEIGATKFIKKSARLL